jgi:chemotaxis protein methyltransferase CheR
LTAHFRRDGMQWRVNERVRSLVRFGVVNLIGDWPRVPSVDVVMLRNVMIYFDLETKRKLLGRVHGILRPDGYLFLGNAESPVNIDDRYVRVPPNRAGCYQLRPFASTRSDLSTSAAVTSWPPSHLGSLT